jgi:hypothetical protein
LVIAIKLLAIVTATLHMPLLAIAIVTLHMIAIILWVIYITVIALHTPLKLTVQIIAIVSISEVRTERHHEHCE